MHRGRIALCVVGMRRCRDPRACSPVPAPRPRVRAAAADATSDTYHPMVPTRFYDTRSPGLTPLGPW